MQRIFIILTLLLFLANGKTAFALNLIFQQYDASREPIIDNCYFIFDGNGLNINPDSWKYSVNYGKLIQPRKINLTGGFVYMTLDNVELTPGDNVIKFYFTNLPGVETVCANVYFADKNLVITGVNPPGGPPPPPNGVYFTENYSVTVSYKETLVNLGAYKYFDTYSKSNYDSIYWCIKEIGTWNRLKNNESIQLNNLTPGVNTLLMRCPTTNKYHHSLFKTYSFTFLYAKFDLPKPPFFGNNEIWKVDKWTILTGYPVGGWFTVDDIGNGLMINPDKLTKGKHQLSYNIMYNGNPYSISKNIEIQPIDFYISGPLSVCWNEITKYEIKNPAPGFTYTWAVDYGSNSVDNLKNTNIITWGENIIPGV
jgi:hypothetical protein